MTAPLVAVSNQPLPKIPFQQPVTLQRMGFAPLPSPPMVRARQVPPSKPEWWQTKAQLPHIGSASAATTTASRRYWWRTARQGYAASRPGAKPSISLPFWPASHSADWPICLAGCVGLDELIANDLPGGLALIDLLLNQPYGQVEPFS